MNNKMFPSSLDLPATPAQYRYITYLAMGLGIPQTEAEDQVKTRRDADIMIQGLKRKYAANKKKRRW
jgi:hypothetical protein